MNNAIAKSNSSDPWADKAGRYRLIAAALFLSYVAFAAYDGKGFYTRYMDLCREHPERVECKPLDLAKTVPQIDPNITLNHGRGRWAFEVGTGLQESEANELGSRLQSSGIQARVIKTSRRKNSLYQVQIGRFPTRKEANETGMRLQADGFISRFTLVEYK